MCTCTMYEPIYKWFVTLLWSRLYRSRRGEKRKHKHVIEAPQPKLSWKYIANHVGGGQRECYSSPLYTLEHIDGRLAKLEEKVAQTLARQELTCQAKGSPSCRVWVLPAALTATFFPSLILESYQIESSKRLSTLCQDKPAVVIVTYGAYQKALLVIQSKLLIWCKYGPSFWGKFDMQHN